MDGPRCLPSISHGGSDVARATLHSDDEQPARAIKITENGSDKSIFLGDYQMIIGARKLRGGVKPFITPVLTSDVGLGLGVPIARCKMPHEVIGAEGGKRESVGRSVGRSGEDDGRGRNCRKNSCDLSCVASRSY